MKTDNKLTKHWVILIVILVALLVAISGTFVFANIQQQNKEKRAASSAASVSLSKSISDSKAKISASVAKSEAESKSAASASSSLAASQAKASSEAASAAASQAAASQAAQTAKGDGLDQIAVWAQNAGFTSPAIERSGTAAENGPWLIVHIDNGLNQVLTIRLSSAGGYDLEFKQPVMKYNPNAVVVSNAYNRIRTNPNFAAPIEQNTGYSLAGVQEFFRIVKNDNGTLTLSE